MSATVESLSVQFQDGVTAGAQAAAAAMDKLAAAMDRTAASSDASDQVIRRRGPSADSVTQKIDGQAAATARLEAIERTYQARAQALTASMAAQGASATETAEALRRLGVLRDQDAARAKAQGDAIEQRFAPAAAATQKLSESTGAAAASARNMGIQFVQGISGIATGQPIFTTLIQQGHQVVDMQLAMGTGIKGTADAFRGMIAGIGGLPTLLAVGVVGAFAAVTAAAISSAGRLAEIRTSLRATQEGYAGLADTVDATARRIAASSSLGLKEATQAVQGLAGAKYFSGTARDLEELTRLAADLGHTMGGDAASGAKTLRDLMDDTSKAAHSLAEQGFRTLTPDVLRYIDAAQAGGDRSKAFSAALAAISAVAKGAANDVDPVTKAWRELGNTVTSSTEGWKPAKDYLVGELAQAIKDTTYLVEKLIAVWNAFKNIGSGLSSKDGDSWNNLKGLGPGLSAKDADAIFSSGRTGGGPAATALGRNTTSDSAASVSVSANAVATEIATILRTQFQANDSQIAGMLGNAFKESGLRPNASIIDSNGLPSVGLWQHNGPRATALAASAGVATGDQASVAQQVSFTMGEITRSPSFKAMWDRMATQSPSQAAGEYNRVFENPKNPGATTPIAAAAADRFSGAGGVISRLPAATPQMVDDTRALADTLAKATENARAFTEVKLAAELDATGKRMGDLITLGQQDSAEFQALAQRAQELTAARYKNVDAETEAQRAAASSLRATQGMTAGEQGLAAAIEARRQVSVNAGLPFGTAQQQQATLEYLAKQSQEAERLAFSLATTQHNSTEMASAFDKGNQSVVDATAKQQAFIEVQRLFPGNTAKQSEALAALTQVYKDVARTAAEAGVAQQNAQGRDNLIYIQAETSTIGLNADQRTKLLAVMKAEQDMHRRFGDVLPKEAQDYIELTSRTADATAAFQHQKSVMDELSGFVSSTFDTIANSITSAMATGQLSMVKLGDIGKSVVSALLSEFVKLAAINPLKNALFGTTSPVLGEVGGLLSNLGGGSGLATGGDAAGLAGAAAGLASLFGGKGVSADASGKIAGGSGGGVLDQLGSVASLAKSADAVSGGSILSGVKDFLGFGSSAASTAGGFGTANVGSAGQTLAGGGLLSGAGIAGAATSFFGNASAATNIALDSLGTVGGAAIQGVATSAQVATASIASGVGFSTGASSAITSGISSISSALPVIGAGIGVVTNLIQGNYTGAALVATGAAIGSIIPGVGTALGAAIGGIVGTFFTPHPKNPYQSTELNTADGRLLRGKTVSQVENAQAAKDSVDAFATGVNQILDVAGLKLANTAGKIGNVGDMFLKSDHPDAKSPSELFNRLRFTDGTNDGSNYAVAKAGDLPGMSFADPTALQAELLKIAGFASGLDALGIHLKAVGEKLTAIQIASVDLQASNGPPSDLRTALSNALPRQTYADTAALDAEIAKVNTFVNGTMPSLLNPVFESTSQLMTQLGAVGVQYAEAIKQAQSYGLATDGLTKAQAKAVELLQAPALKALLLSNTGIELRGAAARGEDTTALQLRQFDLQGGQQRQALAQQYKDIYGSEFAPDAVKSYRAASLELDRTLAAERLTVQAKMNADLVANEQQAAAARKAAARAFGDAQDAANDAFTGIRARQATLSGDTKGAELLGYDAKAAQESKAYARQLVDFFGDSYYQSADYQNRMSELETVHQQERLAIVTKGGADANNALAAAQSSVGNVITSLTDYARSLQTGADSPLSATAQYDLAKGQFQAVQGAAAAGDFNSASKLQGYSQAFLSASRGVNGSGQGYASDYSTVLSAIQAIASAPSDALTNSAMLAATRDQTTTLAAKFDELKAELVAVRRELQQQARAA